MLIVLTLELRALSVQSLLCIVKHDRNRMYEQATASLTSLPLLT